jgi:O-acetyl-ADP-ribose deacetylase (regulator of RNase III)
LSRRNETGFFFLICSKISVKQSSLATFFKPIQSRSLTIAAVATQHPPSTSSTVSLVPTPIPTSTPPLIDAKKRSSTVANVSAAPLKRALTTVAPRSVPASDVSKRSVAIATSSNVESVSAEDLSSSRLMAVMRVRQIDIQVRFGDIVSEHVDVITNAANGSLAHGSGVAGALRRAGGSQFQRDSDDWVAENGTLSEGEVAVTPPGNGKLRCKYVVHAVGPIYRAAQHDESVRLLASAVRNTLLKTHELNCASVSLPAISSGIFGFPKDLCAKVMFDVAEEFCKQHESTTVRQIRFTNFDRETVDVFLSERARRGDDESDDDDDDDDDDDNDAEEKTE